ncbi:MAG: hypothetical protein M3N19_04830 [Candidatus Eremiobacteraeota bacterium]|nr:hypothetical protein [Candidatus Eremiobacteraeota bacterium]
MNKYENLGHRYLVALSSQLQALIAENDVLRSLADSAEVIAATPHDIEQRITGNANRIKQLTTQIGEISHHLSHVRVSDF